ncbi:MAG: DUF1284 domain-containing protein [Clostridium sp.]|nr:DUF1284 domain-containing protein [Clostridium sp.]
MIKIRYHHLMCIPRYKGEGYSKAFCNNLQKIKRELKSNNYTLVDSCDDVCKCCPNNKNGSCRDEEKVSKYDALVKEKLEKNEPLSPEEICSDCSWFYLCKKINKKY